VYHSSPSPFPFLLSVRTAQPQKPPSRTAEAQRHYRRRNTLSSGSDADARHSRETTLHCKLQAQVHARPSALPWVGNTSVVLPPTSSQSAKRSCKCRRCRAPKCKVSAHIGFNREALYNRPNRPLDHPSFCHCVYTAQLQKRTNCHGSRILPRWLHADNLICT
jgi:hypothetical protein